MGLTIRSASLVNYVEVAARATKVGLMKRIREAKQSSPKISLVERTNEHPGWFATARSTCRVAS